MPFHYPYPEHAAAADPHPGYVLESLIDAKGDIIVATGPDAVDRMAVGANGTVKVADSAQATGLRNTAFGVFEGAGDPEGVITAPVGSTYRDTTNGWEYSKGSGAGNTGWRSSSELPRFAIPTGRYVCPTSSGSTGTSNILGNGTLRLAPFFISHSIGVTRIGAEVLATAGEAGSKLRLGIYADTGSGFPGTLVLDAGQINGDSATVQEITLGSTLTLTRGWYWGGAVVQSAPTTQPNVRIVGASMVANAGLGWLLSLGSSLPGAGVAGIGYAASGVSGALPGTFTGTIDSSTGAVPRLLFKLA